MNKEILIKYQNKNCDNSIIHSFNHAFMLPIVMVYEDLQNDFNNRYQTHT